MSYWRLTPPPGTSIDQVRAIVRDVVHGTATTDCTPVEVSPDALPADTPYDTPDWFVAVVELDGTEHRMVFEYVFQQADTNRTES